MAASYTVIVTAIIKVNNHSYIYSSHIAIQVEYSHKFFAGKTFALDTLQKSCAVTKCLGIYVCKSIKLH